MKNQPDVNDVLRGEGVSAVRARHDRARKFEGVANFAPRDVQPAEEADPQLLLPLQFTDAASWQDVDIPPRRWLAHDRIPLRNVCLLMGDGATGKTTIGLQLGVGVRRTGEWIGAVIDEEGPVMFITAEEESEEIQRRLAAILDHNQLSFRDIGGFQVKSLVGEDALLAVPDRAGVIRPTTLFMRVLKEVQAKSPRLIVIEAAADVFGGNENDRGQVRQFMKRWARRFAPASSPATGPMGPGGCGTTCWRKACRVDCIGSSD